MIKIPLLFVCFAVASCSAVPGDSAFRVGRYAAAVKLYESEYRQGNLEAGLRLALMYAQGKGVSVDSTKAAMLFHDLAEKGNVVAAHNLGVCYQYGDGIAKDYSKAAHWYKIAAARNYVWSVYNLGTLYAENKIEPRDDIRGLALLLKATSMVKGDDETSLFIREDRSEHIKRMKDRMTATQIAESEKMALSSEVLKTDEEPSEKGRALPFTHPPSKPS
jgi:TPR repeat protein